MCADRTFGGRLGQDQPVQTHGLLAAQGCHGLSSSYSSVLHSIPSSYSFSASSLSRSSLELSHPTECWLLKDACVTVALLLTGTLLLRFAGNHLKVLDSISPSLLASRFPPGPTPRAHGLLTAPGCDGLSSFIVFTLVSCVE